MRKNFLQVRLFLNEAEKFKKFSAIGIEAEKTAEKILELAHQRGIIGAMKKALFMSQLNKHYMKTCKRVLAYQELVELVERTVFYLEIGSLLETRQNLQYILDDVKRNEELFRESDHYVMLDIFRGKAQDLLVCIQRAQC